MGSKRVFFAQDTFVKIVLKDAVASDTSVPSPVDGAGASGKNSEYFIHKALLASLSPELDKHTNNDMKEGREGVLSLGDVDVPTMEAFLEWAYFKDYTLDSPAAWSAVLPHTKIYVLADRFNITELQTLAYSKIDTLFQDLKAIADQADITALLEAIGYGYDNLLFQTKAPAPATDNSTTDPASEEKLLKYFARYIAWSLETFRHHPEFRKLIAASLEFAEALITIFKPVALPPWVQDMVDAGSTRHPGTEDSAHLSVTPSPADPKHILSRYCTSCNVYGAANIKCKACKKYDYRASSRYKVELYGVDLGTVENERVSGTKDNFKHTCVACKVTNSYGGALSNFSHGGTGLLYQSPENIGYLSCRGCNLEGYWGFMRMEILSRRS